MYLAARIIAQGGELLTIAEPIAVTGLQVEGGRANSYRDRLHEYRWRIRPALGGLDEVGRVVCAAIQPYVAEQERDRVARKVFEQLLTYSYSYWLYDYRAHGELWAAINLALGCFPSNLTRRVPIAAGSLARLVAVYSSATMAGLVLPMSVLEPLKDVVRWTSRKFV
jgi:hypothetical protein